MDERETLNRLYQVTRTRRVAIGLVLLAWVLPALFALNDNIPVSSVGEFTGKLVAMTLFALLARMWAARHYSAGVLVQACLVFALLLVGWSGYVSRKAHDARVEAAVQMESSLSSHVPIQGAARDMEKKAP